MIRNAAARPVAMQIPVDETRIRAKDPGSKAQRASKKYQEIPRENPALKARANRPAEKTDKPEFHQGDRAQHLQIRAQDLEQVDLDLVFPGLVPGNGKNRNHASCQG